MSFDGAICESQRLIRLAVGSLTRQRPIRERAVQAGRTFSISEHRRRKRNCEPSTIRDDTAMRIKLSLASSTVFVAAGLMLTTSVGCRTTASRLSHLPGLGWMASDDESYGEGWAGFEPKSDLPTPSETTQPTSPANAAGNNASPGSYGSSSTSGTGNTTYGSYGSYNPSRGASSASAGSYGSPANRDEGNSTASSAAPGSSRGYGNSTPYGKSGSYFSQNAQSTPDRGTSSSGYGSPSYTASTSGSRFGAAAGSAASTPTAAASGASPDSYSSYGSASYASGSTPSASSGATNSAGAGVNGGYDTGNYYRTGSSSGGSSYGNSAPSSTGASSGAAYGAPTSNYNSSVPSKYDANPYQPANSTSYSTSGSNPYNAGNPYGSLGPQSNAGAASDAPGRAINGPSYAPASDQRVESGSVTSRFEQAAGDTYGGATPASSEVVNAAAQVANQPLANSSNAAESIVNRYAESARNAYGAISPQASQPASAGQQYANPTTASAGGVTAQAYPSTGAQAYDALANRAAGVYDQAKSYAAGAASQVDQAATSAAQSATNPGAAVRGYQDAANDLSATASRYTQEVLGNGQQNIQEAAGAYGAAFGNGQPSAAQDSGPATNNSTYNPLPTNQWPEPTTTIKRSDAPWRPGSTGDYRGSSVGTPGSVKQASFRPLLDQVLAGQTVASKGDLTLAVGDKYQFPQLLR